jgi:hypothetical protein
MQAKFGSLVVVGMAVVAATAIGWQLNSAAELRLELEREKSLATTFARVRADHGRLLAAQPVAGEMERIAAEAGTLSQVRAEVAALRQQAELAERANAEKKNASVERFAVGSAMVAGDWKNAGGATPRAALETVLWAGAGGDVEALTSMLGFIPGSRTRNAAQALLGSLPDSMRAQYDSPERLIAFLTVKDVPLGAVELRKYTELEGWPFPAVQMVMVLTAADGKPKDASLAFMNPGDGWKLVVTDAVVAKYAAMLKDANDAAGGK